MGTLAEPAVQVLQAAGAAQVDRIVDRAVGVVRRETAPARGARPAQVDQPAARGARPAQVDQLAARGARPAQVDQLAAREVERLARGDRAEAMPPPMLSNPTSARRIVSTRLQISFNETRPARPT